MKILIKIFYWVIGIIALLVIISFLLPKTYKVERSVFIKSNPGIIFDLTGNFNLWHVWAPWTKETDSTAIFAITGEPAQVGTSWKWNGKKLGNGEMVLTELKPGQLVAYDLAFDEGKYRSKGKFILESQVDSVKVTWLDEGDLGYNPVSRYMGLLMNKMMGPDFEKGLSKLKMVAETRRNWPKMDEVVIPEQTVIAVKDSAGPGDYERVFARAYGDLYGFIGSGRLVQKGAPFSIYLKWDSVTSFSVMNICIPVEKAEQGRGRVKVQTLPEFKAVRAIYFGSYSRMAPAYNALSTYVKDLGKTEDGAPSEIYITDPMSEKDTAKWETHIVFPVK